MFNSCQDSLGLDDNVRKNLLTADTVSKIIIRYDTTIIEKLIKVPDSVKIIRDTIIKVNPPEQFKPKYVKYSFSEFTEDKSGSSKSSQVIWYSTPTREMCLVDTSNYIPFIDMNLELSNPYNQFQNNQVLRKEIVQSIKLNVKKLIPYVQYFPLDGNSASQNFVEIVTKTDDYKFNTYNGKEINANFVIMDWLYRPGIMPKNTILYFSTEIAKNDYILHFVGTIEILY